MRYIYIAMIMAGIHAQAKIKTSDSAIKPVYILVSSGQQTDALTATQASIKGERVLKCDEVEATASDKGSISLKKKK